MPEPLVTRFAPSPTGHLHIGGARTALFCWAYAKRHGGRFMIRIEDTDQARSSDESARGILDDLAWLGIEWDDGPHLRTKDGRVIGGASRPVGPYFQAQRVDIYNAYIDHLMESGHAYPAFETPEELEALRKAATAAKATFKYQRPADVKLGTAPTARIARARAGERHVVRFAMPPEGIRVDDQVLGEVKFGAGEIDDFVIRKADGFPTYHFAVVIDDELMGVTHVLRAQEHLMNTPRHVAMQRALTRLARDGGGAFRTPFYAHMPLIFNMDGAKMSKRDKAKAARKAAKDAMAKNPALTVAALAAGAGIDVAALTGFIAADNDAIETAEALAAHFRMALPEIEVWDFRRNGYLPEAITNFIALLGWSPGLKDEQGKDVEKFNTAFLAQRFDVDRIGKVNARFDRVKLLSFNGDAIGVLSDSEFLARTLEWAEQHEPTFAARLRSVPADRLAMLVSIAKQRCKTLRDLMKVADFALVADDALAFDAAAVAKSLVGNNGAGRAVLTELRAILGSMEPAAFQPAAINTAIEQFAAAKGMKLGEAAQPLRIGVTGSTVSPPLGETLAVLGRESSLRRIDRCLASCGL